MQERIPGEKYGVEKSRAAFIRLSFPALLPLYVVFIFTKSSCHAKPPSAHSFPHHSLFGRRADAFRPGRSSLGNVGTATLSYPGPFSPGTYTATTYSNTTLDYNHEGTIGALQADYPFGTYTVNYSGGTAGTGAASVNYTQAAFSGTVPTLTAATFNALSGGLNSTQGFSLAFNSVAPSPAATSNFVFVNIANFNTGAVAYDQAFQPSTTASEFIPAGALVPNTAYQLDVDFSDRIPSTSNGIDTTLGFDQVLLVNFTTGPQAVPEASTPISFGLLLALGLSGRRSRESLAKIASAGFSLVSALYCFRSVSAAASNKGNDDRLDGSESLPLMIITFGAAI